MVAHPPKGGPLIKKIEGPGGGAALSNRSESTLKMTIAWAFQGIYLRRLVREHQLGDANTMMILTGPTKHPRFRVLPSLASAKARRWHSKPRGGIELSQILARVGLGDFHSILCLPCFPLREMGFTW
jgi:hypothetical protein